MSRRRRVAVAGLSLESNAFSPVTRREDFEALVLRSGEALRPLIESDAILGFGPRLRALGDYELVPTLVAVGGAGGPCDHAFYEEALVETRARLRGALPVDGLFVFGHGAGLTTELDDLDGAYLAALRDVVGPECAIVAELDLHGNVSPQMVESADCLIAYRTNPHVDVKERSVEAAEILHEILEGMEPRVAFVKLPLAPPSVTQLTGPGHPYGDLIRRGEARMGGPIANVSILSGFAHADSRHVGMSVVVTARGDEAAADALARELAELAWADRHRYRVELTSLDDAARMARAAGEGDPSPPLAFADVADNPGGGGRGNTVWILEAFHRAGARGVQMGLFHDPVLAAEAHAVGEGGRFRARFNRDESDPLSGRFEAEARVACRCDGRFTGRHGMMAGVPMNLGASCLLELDGIAVAVSSVRQQIFGPEFLEHFGLRPAEARSFVLKSRGHFRAGFSGLVSPDRVVEVDAPGLTTPNLRQLPWRGLPRPVFPLDPETEWPARRSAEP